MTPDPEARITELEAENASLREQVELLAAQVEQRAESWAQRYVIDSDSARGETRHMSVEETKAVTRRYLDEFHNQRNMAVAAEIAPAASAEAIQRLATMMRTAFPDYQVEIQHMVAQGDKVATVWQGHGTHQGNWPSPIGIISATGRRVTWTGTTTLRIEDGKIAETLGSNWDHLGILQQMGQVAEIAPRSGA